MCTLGVYASNQACHMHRICSEPLLWESSRDKCTETRDIHMLQGQHYLHGPSLAFPRAVTSPRAATRSQAWHGRRPQCHFHLISIRFSMAFIVFPRFPLIFINFLCPEVTRECRGVSASFRRLRGRVWGPRGEKFPYIYYGSARHLYGLLSISTPHKTKFPYIYYGSGRPNLTTGEGSFSK